MPGRLSEYNSRENLPSAENVLPREFYRRETLAVAKEVLGMFLCRRIEDKEIRGKIVEVEAYQGRDDPTSYAYQGETRKSKLMFGQAGMVFIYLIYGRYYCFNITTEEENVPGAILIRAIEPIAGIELMQKYRKTNNLANLTNGPGKLTQAFLITKKQNGLDLTFSEELFLMRPTVKIREEICSSPRIGTRETLARDWRFYLKNNPFVSRP